MTPRKDKGQIKIAHAQIKEIKTPLLVWVVPKRSQNALNIKLSEELQWIIVLINLFHFEEQKFVPE